jgi:hypothetical protein
VRRATSKATPAHRRDKGVLVSTPKPTRTIDQLLDEFLAEQKARLSHKTFLKYPSIVSHFKL